jgi:hypothetical protein
VRHSAWVPEPSSAFEPRGIKHHHRGLVTCTHPKQAKSITLASKRSASNRTVRRRQRVTVAAQVVADCCRKSGVWRIDRCGCAPCPDPNNTVRESTSASDAAGLSRSINNRELDVHRHDDPPLPLSRHSWLTQPVFLYCLCMVHSKSLIDPWCTCCARPETLQALPNLQPPLRTPQRLTVVQNTQSPWHANIRGRRANTPRESIQPRNHADAHSRMVRTVEGTVVRALCRSTTTTDTRSLRAFTPMVRVVGRASTLSSSSHLLSRVVARCR